MPTPTAVLVVVGNEVLSAQVQDENGPWAAGGWPTVRGLILDDKPYLGEGRQFGGCHPGGLNVLYLDGRVNFMSDSVQPRVFEALVTLKED